MSARTSGRLATRAAAAIQMHRARTADLLVCAQHQAGFIYGNGGDVSFRTASFLPFRRVPPGAASIRSVFAAQAGRVITSRGLAPDFRAQTKSVRAIPW